MPNPEDGNYRYVAERRQYGGLLMLTGFCALIQPLAGIATVVGPDGSLVTDAGEPAFWSLVGACCLFAIGVSSMLVGFIEFIMDSGEITQSTLLIIMTQTAYIPYVSDMAVVGYTMVKDPPQFFVAFPGDTAGQINQQRLNETDEVIFIGSVGIVGIFAYGFAFVGAIAFMQFALYAFRKGKPQDRNADYFRSRLGFYSIMLFIGGLCQILLGSFATELKISNGGRIEGGLLRVAMFVVHFPYLTIVVGIVQFLNGFWGFCRAFYVGVGGRDDNFFQYSMAFLWVLVLTMQDIVQISFLPEGMLAPAAPTFAALSFGLIFMPAYLDYKMRNTPIRIDESYYFGPAPSPKDENQPMLIRAILPEGVGNIPMRKVYVVEKPGYIQSDYDDDGYAYDDNYEVVPEPKRPEEDAEEKREETAVAVEEAAPDNKPIIMPDDVEAPSGPQQAASRRNDQGYGY